MQAGGNVNNAANYKNAANRYKNIYTAVYSPKVGDATTETSGWHGSNVNAAGPRVSSDPNGYWNNYIGAVRAIEGAGSIFSYDIYFSNPWPGQVWSYSEERASYTKKYYARATVVQGDDI